MDNCGKKFIYMWVIILQLYNDIKFDLSSGHVTFLDSPWKCGYTPHFPEGQKITKIAFQMKVSVNLWVTVF